MRILFLFSILPPPLHSLPHMCVAPETSPSFPMFILSPIPYNPCLLDEETDALTVDKGLAQVSQGTLVHRQARGWRLSPGLPGYGEDACDPRSTS